MSEYRPARRRQRSRSGRRGSDQRNQNGRRKTEAVKPTGFWGWLKKLFGVSSAAKESSPNGSRRSSENLRNGVSVSQRGNNQSGRLTRRDNREENNRDKSESSTTTTTSTSSSRRKAELLEVSTPRLYVGNLGYDITESDLFELFSQAAPVKNVEIARDRENERSKGFGFVEFSSVEDAKLAQAKLNQYELAGRPLLVSGAKASASRRSASSTAKSPRPAEEKPEGSALTLTSATENVEEEDVKFNR